ncbi:MAG: histidinol-phosphate transaminase [Chloroflexi bacterium]|nr:histidinol-phosphate transaminase [Chloroflexota bacterium]
MRPESASRLRLNPHIVPFTRSDERGSPEDVGDLRDLDQVYELANNENPLGPSPRVVEAIKAEAASLSYYPKYSDIDLRRAICAVLGRGLSPAQIFTGCSGFESLELIARAFLRPGDEMILTPPTFSGAYRKVAEPLGARIVEAPLAPETFHYRPAAVLNAITDKTKLIMLCNPNNPTGTVVPAEAMDELMNGLPDHALVVADEVYHHFVESPHYPDSLRYVLADKNIVIVHSFSKAYGLAGLRLGYGIAKQEIANYISGLQRGFHQNKLALAAGIAACEDQAHVRRSVDYLRGEVAWLHDQLDRLDIKYWKSSTNFIMFETQLLAEELNQKLRGRGFLLRTQTRNGLPRALRVSAGTRAANQAFVSALEDILAGASG